MKKLFIVVVWFGLLTGCSKTEIEKIPSGSIPDQSFMDYLLAGFDADSDGFISMEEAGAVKEIYLEIALGDQGAIRSLKGIEHHATG